MTEETFWQLEGRRLAHALIEHLDHNVGKDIHAQEIWLEAILDTLQLVACMLDSCWRRNCSRRAATRRTASRVGCPAMRCLLDWTFTILFLLVFGLLLGVFDPLQRLARLFGQRPQEIVAGALQISLVWAFHLCGTRIATERSPEVSRHMPYIVIANHQSMFDIPILGALFFSNFPKYVSKRELARWIPSISYNLRRGGNALIDRHDRIQATEAIRELGRTAQARGVSVVIYPEGTRARAGELGAFRPAGTLELLGAAPALAVVPVAIDGAWRLLRHNLLPVPFGTRIRVYIGAPISRSRDENQLALLERVRSEIDAALRRWREAEAR